MLKRIFDCKGIFSFLDMLKMINEVVSVDELFVVPILVELDLSPKEGADVLVSAELLGVIEETDRMGYYKLNLDSKAMIIVDEFNDAIEDFCKNEVLDKIMAPIVEKNIGKCKSGCECDLTAEPIVNDKDFLSFLNDYDEEDCIPNPFDSLFMDIRKRNNLEE